MTEPERETEADGDPDDAEDFAVTHVQPSTSGEDFETTRLAEEDDLAATRIAKESDPDDQPPASTTAVRPTSADFEATTVRSSPDLEATSVRPSPIDLAATELRESPLEDLEATRLATSDVPPLSEGGTVRMGGEDLADIHAAVDRLLSQPPTSQPTSAFPSSQPPASQPTAPFPTSVPPSSLPRAAFAMEEPTAAFPISVPEPPRQKPVPDRPPPSSAPRSAAPVGSPHSGPPLPALAKPAAPTRTPAVVAIVGFVLLIVAAALALMVLTRG